MLRDLVLKTFVLMHSRMIEILFWQLQEITVSLIIKQNISVQIPEER